MNTTPTLHRFAVTVATAQGTVSYNTSAASSTSALLKAHNLAGGLPCRISVRKVA